MNESQVSCERNRQSYCSGGFLQFSPLPIGIRIFLCIIVRGLPSFSIRRQTYNKPRWLFGPRQESSGYQLLAVKPASYQWVAEATYFPRRVLLERRNNVPSLEAASRISPCRLAATISRSHLSQSTVSLTFSRLSPAVSAQVLGGRFARGRVLA